MKNTETLLCTIHKLKYEVPRDIEVSVHMSCPSCSLKNIADLKQEIKEVKEHRDILLKAIEIKTQVIVHDSL